MTGQTATAVPLDELSRRAVELLTRELGLVDTLRFLGQFSTETDDYTAERRHLLAGVTRDQIVADIKAMRSGDTHSNAVGVTE